MVKFYAYNHGFDCNSAISNETKKVSFLVVVSNYQKYTTTMTWQHWTSGFFNQNLHTEVTQSDTYGLNPTGGQEADGYGGVFDIGINLAPMPDGTISLQTLGLGKVSVTNGYGKLVKLSPFRNAIAVTQLDKLFFHFSKSLAVCSAVNGVIKCPNGVSFVNIDRKVTFICTQTSNESPMCPYLNIKSSTLSSMVKLENIS
ncbi:MAG: hypothetical protein EP298_00460 [Gammaproteobacteria bacterium]|nr:MAG: hypothetical protein EP298_00460 [Gammaproteobacteria bacterium]UTW41909.1 hypothetical protein KFE69_10395 [bacterium SCSIO 12844]